MSPILRSLLVVLITGLVFVVGSPPVSDFSSAYRTPANKLIEAALEDEEGWNRLVYLCVRIGNRLSGSPQLEEAVEWAAGEMRAAGFSNVVTPSVEVPRWVRGSESARVLAPVERELPMLGLGGSVGTPPAGIEARIVVISSFAELKQRPDAEIQGRIVVYDVPWEGYGRTVRYRRDGASAAAARGARAILLRSVGPVSLQTPHTGAMRYDEDIAKIPAAAITHEGAALLRHLVESGDEVTVRLKMEAETLAPTQSANVIGEIPGRVNPEQVVVMGGHLDSWDVGQGAHDDGAGCIASLQAAALIKKLGLKPRRTIRVVLWTNEENGLAGGRSYREWIGDQIRNHVAAIEMDGGSERPRGFGFQTASESEKTRESLVRRMSGVGRLLDSIEAGAMTWGGGGADIGPLMREGVPGFGLRTVGERYFHWHHTEADTIDKIDKDDFRRNIAALAVLAYVLADMPQTVDEMAAP